MTDHMSGYTEGHTVRAYDAEMARLRDLLLEMGGLVADQIIKSVQALTERDLGLCQQVLRREKDVNRYDLECEELVLNVLAKRQPMGADLRAVMCISRAVMDLERCGDTAKKIAKIARRLSDDQIPPVPEFAECVSGMADVATGLLKSVLEALDDADVGRAVQVAEADEELDIKYKDALRMVHTLLAQRGGDIEHASDMVIAIKALERVGDRAKNIAKYVIFLVEGKDVRHVKTKNLGDEVSS